jgi:hypothetical protein
VVRLSGPESIRSSAANGAWAYQPCAYTRTSLVAGPVVKVTESRVHWPLGGDQASPYSVPRKAYPPRTHPDSV